LSHPIFISYARRTSAAEAEALHDRLGGAAFLDRGDIAPGEGIPLRLVDALLAAKVFVVFADETYFTRRYCVEELGVALAAYRALGDQDGSALQAEAIDPIVVALPGGVRPEELDRLPAGVRTANWPASSDTGALSALTLARVELVQRTIGERLAALGVKQRVREDVAAHLEIPLPRNLAGVRLYPLRSLQPSIEDAFVDRGRELWEIHTTLSTERVETAAAALTGSLEGGGGFGKTRLVIEYVHRYGPQTYPGGLFWVNADVGPDGLEEQFHGILSTLRPETLELIAFREAGRNATAELARVLHELPAEESVLYVVDNIPEPAPSKEPKPLSTWCPAVGKVTLLVTSRASQSVAAGVRRLAVDVLPPGPAVSLLTREYRDHAAIEAGAWHEVVEWVGRLPLALVLLNAALRAGGITSVELLELARTGRPTEQLDRQMDALRGSVPSGVLRGITEAFQASYLRLPEEVQRAARLIAELSPEPVPIALFDAIGGNVADARVRTTLLTRSVLSPVPGGQVSMLGRMHRVLADYLRSIGWDEGHTFVAVCDGIIDVFDQHDIGDPSSWPLLAAVLPHARQEFDRVVEAAEAAEAETGVALGLRIGVLLGAQGSLDEAQAVKETTVRFATESLGEEHLDTLAAIGSLANTLGARGRLWEAREMQERVLTARRRLLGDDHPDTLAAMDELANTVSAQGDLFAATEEQVSVLEAHRRLLGEEHPDTLTSMNNLAETLRMRGDLSAARELQERVLEVERREFGEEHPNTLTAMSNLALTLFDQGVVDDSRELQERTVELSRRVLGEEHPATLTSMSTLASTMRAQGDLSAARELQGRVLEASRRLLGQEHPETLVSMSNLGSTMRAQGDPAGARELLEHAAEASRDLLGLEHEATTASSWNLLLALMDLDDEEAMEDVWVNLGWLLEREPAVLSAHQRAVRDQLLELIEGPDEPDG